MQPLEGPDDEICSWNIAPSGKQQSKYLDNLRLEHQLSSGLFSHITTTGVKKWK